MKRAVLLIISILSAAYLLREQIKKLIKKLLRKYYSLKYDNINDDVLDITNKALTESEINNIMEPILYYKKMKSKKMRSKLVQNLGIKYNINHDIITLMSEFIDDLHNASLVIDDIQDNSNLRRNNKTAHLKYGLSMSIGATNLYIFRKMNDFNDKIKKVIDINDLYKKHPTVYNPELLKAKVNNIIGKKIINELYKMNIGQQLDVYWTYKKIIPTLDKYLYMIKNKTGILMTLIIDIIYELTSKITEKDYKEYRIILEKVALFYQIRDDYINLCDIDYWKLKGFCEDFNEKKNSYIIIKYYNSNKVSKKSKKIFFDTFYKDK
jgi:geranylgeranyl pyrophosphate synthase